MLMTSICGFKLNGTDLSESSRCSEKPGLGGLPPNPPLGDVSEAGRVSARASPRPPAQEFIGCDEFSYVSAIQPR